MTLTGIMPLRNGVALGYPYELAIRSLQRVCDEVIVGVDPTSEDDTMARVRALGVRVVESVWDMGNHDGHRNCEISVQTQKLCDAATGDWVFSLQADEVLHERDVGRIRDSIGLADGAGVTGLEMRRLYFYGSLAQVRNDWSLWMVRLFRRGLWRPDVDGAMRFDPVGEQQRWHIPSVPIYHYSRVGDAQVIAERVRNLDNFFHEPDRVAAGTVAPYDFGALRKLDTYVLGHEAEADPNARLVPFDVTRHPAGVRELFG